MLGICVIRNAMKKLLLGCLILITSACQTATPAPTPSPAPTATVPASPTPVPATNTPELTPTLELTATPLPRFFTNEFDSSLAGWITLQAGNDGVPKIETNNSTLRLQIDSPYTWLYTLYSAEDYTNVYVETEFVNSALSPASIGMVCQYSDEDGWFEFNISTDGTYNVLLGKWLSVGIAEYLPVSNGSSKAIVQSGAPQKIGLTCTDKTLYLFIDGNLIRSVNVSDYELTSGKIGLTASSFENTPVIAVFNYVTVSEAPSP